MCGILGYIDLNGKGNVPVKQLKAMFKETQSRGRDATGLYYIKRGGRYGHIVKGGCSADNFIPQVNWGKLKNSQVVLGHCRAATQGTPKLNKNNHPLRKDGLILIHNGVIYNDWDLGVKRDSCDSKAILNAICQSDRKTTFGKILDGLTNVSGSMACAIFDQKSKEVFLFRNSMPLVVGFKDGTIVFGSTGMIVHKAKARTKLDLREYNLMRIKLDTREIRTCKIETKKRGGYNVTETTNTTGETRTAGYNRRTKRTHWDAKTGQWVDEYVTNYGGCGY